MFTFTRRPFQAPWGTAEESWETSTGKTSYICEFHWAASHEP